MSRFVLKGNIIYSQNQRQLRLVEHGYLVCQDGRSQGVYESLPGEYQKDTITDYGDALIIPGLSDLHMHAPQYAMRANGMDMELLDWLDTYTFPIEGKYEDMDYAKAAYGQFVKALEKGATTRVCMFATLHNEATLYLMERMEKSGIKGYVGKVNMDRNSPEYLCEESAERSLANTRSWLTDCKGRFQRIQPILTPRFVPSCTDELMQGLGKLQQETGLPVQSHLSENFGEIAWVKELCPETSCYGEAYDKAGLFGSNGKTIMAHCVHSTPEEIELMKERGVFVAHCPQSNTNLSSGVAPARIYLEKGMNIGLGTDMAGGYSLSILRAMADAVQASKLRWRLLDETTAPISLEEAFYMGTLGGGAFFGKVGSFEKDYEFDAVVIDDTRLLPPHVLTLRERLERVVYLENEAEIIGKYVGGQRVI